ncbi:hypothetical protein ACIBL6_18055 [Streptomyces sp. NPDC050400]|uniref:hypothetical protein n=1 Tax=Streptomyces sp. NPDC050400 TaxID=3365610 RepID=UPI003793E829
MTVRRIVLRIERIVLDSAAAEGRSAAEVAEVVKAALQQGLAVSALPSVGQEPRDRTTGSRRSAQDRLRLTVADGGLDGAARAAAGAIGRVLADAGPGHAAMQGSGRDGDTR